MTRKKGQMVDLFIGYWVMDPQANAYEYGTPPQDGDYIIETQGDSYLITMHWTTPDGQQRDMFYTGTPDEAWYPVENTPDVEMMMHSPDANTLLTEARKGDHVFARARRVLNEDGTVMTIDQVGTAPDGSPYTNRSVYHRKK
jgi:hypothetical protein